VLRSIPRPPCRINATLEVGHVGAQAIAVPATIATGPHRARAGRQAKASSSPVRSVGSFPWQACQRDRFGRALNLRKRRTTMSKSEQKRNEQRKSLELSESEMNAVQGGFNPQPDPPGMPMSQYYAQLVRSYAQRIVAGR
jgi:hypothetical protein